MRCTLQRLFPQNLLHLPLRPYSTNTTSSPTPSKYAHLLTDLASRRLPILHDYFNPQPSYLLSTSLAPFLSPPSNTRLTRLPSIKNPPHLPPSHHIAYFPSPVPTTSLLPDGTDTLHSPGPPFTRRLWAGGSIRFPRNGGPQLNGQRAVCVEGIRDVQIKGNAGEEKVFVGIERRIALLQDEDEDDEAIRSRVLVAGSEEWSDAVIIERRNLVFLQSSSPSSDSVSSSFSSSTTAGGEGPPQTQHHPRKGLYPPTGAAFTISLTPTPSLLFRYSALMFNAHTIHLDRTATRAVEHQPDLLVHGPLSLTLMVEVLRRHLLQEEEEEVAVIRNIDYRNLQPLYCGEEMRVCGKPRKGGKRRGRSRKAAKGEGGGETKEPKEETQMAEDDGDSWDVWIESKRGLAVRGVVETAAVSDRDGNRAGDGDLDATAQAVMYSAAATAVGLDGWR